MKINRIGVISWSATVPKTSYFGGYALRSLDNDKFRARLPYFYREGDFPEVTRETVDSQLEYAIGAGIDYLAYCYYTSDVIENPRSDVEREAGWSDLNLMMKVHASSELRDKIGYCAILRPSKMNDADYGELAKMMLDGAYEKIDGRPLAYFFGAGIESIEGKAKLEAACSALGLKPFTVIITGDAKKGDYDAISRYAYCGSHETYTELIDGDIRETERLKRCELPIIPHFSAGWNPEPRIENPVPWVDYPSKIYAPRPTSDEVAEMGRAVRHWVESNPDRATLGHVLAFAWNEFEEGGYICPTIGENGEVDTSVLDGFSRAVKIMKGIS